MTLMFVSFSAVPFGSNDVLFYRTALLALQMGHRLIVSAPYYGGPTPAEYDSLQRLGAQVEYRKCLPRPDNFFLRQLRKVRHRLTNPQNAFRSLQSGQLDVVVVSDPGTYHMLTVPAFQELLDVVNVPYVTISQYNEENSSIAADLFARARQLFHRAHTTIFVSQRNLEVARRQLCLPLTNARVIDNPPNLTGLHSELFPQGDLARMAIVARLESGIKGQDLVLEALSQEVWRDRLWFLDLYGVGPDEAYLRSLSTCLGLDERVKFCGYATNIRDVWKEHMALVLCSSAEGKPLSIMEAMVCGRPCIVTNVGGNAELIEDGVTGFVAPSATLPAIAETLERAWQQRRYWRDMGERAHTVAVERLRIPPERRLWTVIEEAGRPGPSG